MSKQLQKTPETKNFTVRLDKGISDAIREQAKAFNMSLSYYVAALSSLDMTYGLLEHYGDPFEKPAEDVMSNEEIQETLRKLQAAGVNVTVGDNSPPAAIQENTTTPDAPAAQSDAAILKAAKEQAKRPPIRPKMKTISELVAMQARAPGSPQTRAQMAGGVGDITRQMQQAQIQASKEKRREDAIRKNILEAVGEEVIEDDGQAEEG